MATQKQRSAAQKNMEKAQDRRRSTTSRNQAGAQSEGRGRAKPGVRGGGDYFHVEVRPKAQFATFRTHDVGRPGHVQRVAGKRPSGRWDTAKWLIHKEDAHVENGELVADTPGARAVLGKLSSKPVHVAGDRFAAQPRRNIPEQQKPTPAQRRARRENIRKAQQARRREA